MTNYYTSIDIVNGQYVGTVYNSNNNAEIYKSKTYTSQQQVTDDVDNFLASFKPVNKTPTGSYTPGYTNTAILRPIVASPARCCGN